MPRGRPTALSPLPPRARFRPVRPPPTADAVLIDLATLIAGLPARPDPAALVAGFVPPRRFADKRFDGYAPDPRRPSQARAAARLCEVAAELRAGGLGRRL